VWRISSRVSGKIPVGGGEYFPHHSEIDEELEGNIYFKKEDF
jgi:hypothetical protein